MIVLALSAAAMLVVASLTGRALAKARDEWSVEFVQDPPKLQDAANRVIPRGPRWSVPHDRTVAVIESEMATVEVVLSTN
jgi:hypothetical protein